MNILIISRDRAWIKRIRRLYDDGVTTVMVIPTVYWLSDPTRVPKEPDIVLLDIERVAPEIWSVDTANLRSDLGLKVIVVDRRAFWRRARTAFDNYAVGYMSKAKRTTDAKIRKAVREAFRSALPLLPTEHLKKKLRKGEKK